MSKAYKKIADILFRKNLSEIDFIEKRRKYLRTCKRMKWLHIAIVIGYFCLFPLLFESIPGWKNLLPEGSQKYIWIGLGIGLSLGFLASLMLINSVTSIMHAFNLFSFNRDTELMIKYHELLKQIAEDKENKKVTE